jgi:hypothetical protein
MGILQPIPDLNLSLRSELYGIDNQIGKNLYQAVLISMENTLG